MSLGLTKAQVDRILIEAGVEDGKKSSAKALREAIATVIAENNKKIEEYIKDNSTARFG